MRRTKTPFEEEFERYMAYQYADRFPNGSEIFIMLNKAARHFANFGSQLEKEKTRSIMYKTE